MIVDFEGRWAFVRVPRCGTTTLAAILTVPPFRGIEVGVPRHEMHLGPELAGFRLFCSVRNPYARAASLWRWFTRTGPAWPHHGMSWPDYCRSLVARPAGGDPMPWMTCSDWLRLCGREPDGVVSVESLARDLGCLGLHGDAPMPTIPRLNGTDAWDGPEWDAVTRRMVRSWGAEDFDRFGYDPRDVP